MKYKNYYEILGVNRKTPKEEIKSNFRKLAKKYHPDSLENTEKDDLKFKDINEAYDTLINEEKRKKYDRQVARYGYGFIANETPLSNIKYEFKSGSNVLGDIFQTILGFNKSQDNNLNIDSKQKPEKGKDITSNLEISLLEGLTGAEKRIAVKGYKGGIKTFSVNVPIGIKNGDKIRLATLGHPGKNGGKNGDLIINVSIKEDSEFTLKGKDLIKEIYISPAAAILGNKYKVNLFNNTIMVDLPKYMKQNEYIHSKGNGYIDENNNRGDLLLHVNIEMPSNLTNREENLYEQLYKLEQRKLELK